MTRDLAEFNRELMGFLAQSPTPFHAVANCREALTKAGFEVLAEGDHWNLQPDGRYVVVRNGSALVAFNGAAVPAADAVGLTGQGGHGGRPKGLRLFGAHTDSPCLKVKPNPVLLRKGCFQTGVEVYGGVLLAPWFDRDLSLAGRVVYQADQGRVEQCLVDWRRPLAIIPSLAIHLDRDANNNRSINPQQHVPPVLLQCSDPQPTDFRALVLEQMRREHPERKPQRVLDYELSYYDCQPPSLVGFNQDFLSSARLDNLLSCFIGLRALLDSDQKQPFMLVFNDHEEVGSGSAEGAAGTFLSAVLARVLGNDPQVGAQVISRSMLISADNAHGVHPNFIDRHDENHGPLLNGGPVIKINSNQRYATNSLTAAFYRCLSESLGLPSQVFVTRADLGCGSTIGPLTAARIGIRTLDIGVPQWAMHSIRETCGSRDPHTFYRVMRAFFEAPNLPEG